MGVCVWQLNDCMYGFLLTISRRVRAHKKYLFALASLQSSTTHYWDRYVSSWNTI